MSVADEPIGRASRRLSRRVGRTSLHQMVFADGGPILCVIIGTPYGRWHAEFTADTSAGVEATRLLCEVVGFHRFVCSAELAVRSRAAHS